MTAKPRRAPRSHQLVAAGAAAAVLGLATSACDFHPNDRTLPGQVATGNDGYTITVSFDRVENLVPNSAVLYDDTTVGTVTNIEVKDWRAIVKMRLLKDVPIDADASFSIGQKTLLGAQYVNVSPPNTRERGGDVFSHGDAVPVSQSGTYPATEQILGAAALLLNNGGLSQISTITAELNRALQGRVPDVRSILTTLNQLLGTLDDNKRYLIGTLEEVNHLTGQLRADSTVVADAIDTITPALHTLNRQRRRLTAAVTAAGDASVVATRVIRDSSEAALADVAYLRPTVRRLAEVASDIPESLEYLLSIPFPVTTTRNAFRGDYANLFATLDISVPELADVLLNLPPELQSTDPTAAPLTQPGALGTSDDPDSDAQEPDGSTSDGPPSTTPDRPSECQMLAAILGTCR